jgi:hypothetical protein
MISVRKAVWCVAGLGVILLFVNQAYSGNKSKVNRVEKNRIMCPVEAFHPKTYVCYFFKRLVASVRVF